MDPVGPWSAYASYNRLAGVQASASGSELHHHLAPTGPTGAPPTTTASLLSGGFLSPPPVGYETVFSPLFHHAGTKPPTHYVSQVTQHRQALAQVQASKQTPEGEYHQGQGFFEPGTNAWQQNSPFGILPHESVVPSTTSSKSTVYENFNAHFAAAQSLNHLNSQLAAAKNASTRSQSPHISNSSVKVPTTQSSNSNFFQVSSTFSGDSINNKFATTNASNLQQSCIVSSPPVTSTSKDYRVPQVSNRGGGVFLGSPNPTRSVDKSFVPPPNKQNQIQTKAQTKIYPELSNHSERRSSQPEENQNQSSPVSFTMDGSSRLNYAGSNSSSNKRPQFQHSTTYRHYQPGNNTETDFQRHKTGADYTNSNGPDCNVVVPRRPSPLQAHSQASPLGHAPSPAYPMYNSPMNSMSSPQQSSNQVTPPSPLDVTVSRSNSQTSNVAYPSVITRTLNSDKNFPDRYERSGQQQQPSQNQNCWEERQAQQRKFQNQPNTSLNNYNSTNNIDATSRQVELVREQRTGNLGLSERQPTYFDSNHQVSLQDLSSCRGDPMSIVKNLQQQQGCQVQQISDIKQEAKLPIKRRKSSDKINTAAPELPASTMTEYFTGRIPPPAHSSANPQQQNGTYFDFDRWNLPPPTTKMFASQTIHQQHQSLMVPHPHTHHPPPPLPYFTPFHLPPHPTEFPSSVELTPISTYEQSPQTASSQFLQDDQPKVVVPNIEEELNFLSEDTGISVSSSTSQRPSAITNSTNKADKPSGPGAGFMNSYLKFLQGERDSSPPPASKGSRKQTWSRAKPFQPEPKQDSNGVSGTLPPLQAATRLSQGDPQDDPRYFPLPKERKRNCFDSSDDGFSSDEDLFNRKVVSVKSETSKEKSTRKGRPPKPGGPAERKRARQAALYRQKFKDEYEGKDLSAMDLPNLPRRESTKRAAKEKTNIQQMMAKQTGEEDIEEPAEFVDSDSDPAWTPQARDDEEEMPLKRGRKPKQAGRKRGSRNLISAAAQGAGIQEIDGYSDMLVQTKKQKATTVPKLPQKQSAAPTLEDNIAAAVAQQNSIVNASDDNPFKTGEFVAIKGELDVEWPPIWRVDGKTLLQKYEPFEKNGQTLYRNISTYTSWTPDSKKQYVTVPVRYKIQSHLETIVEFLRKDMVIIDYEFLERVMVESEIYQDNFEVYIQTLISQALDSNFLMEIFQEQDEYFLTNVKTIDDITDSKRQKMISLLRWPNPVQIAVTTWPCFNVIRELSAADIQLRPCAACLKPGVAVRVLMYGQPYNATTLEGCQPNPQTIEKDFLMCRICASQVELFNKITHQKYLMYIECAKRVAEKRTTDPHKDTTCILNELLADEYWLTQLFCEVRKSWAEADCLENSYLLKNAMQ
ncbi:hypothetical protein RN001_002477 [Aquatica leii]|uniref:DUF4211 domain-containing protein n=1 Tax=Aquatica leii TaxID=1421715 RepID=A0AAN7PPW8_9COLE|nr:hypothetical protein RN001_002477 [Aquatica leii]